MLRGLLHKLLGPEILLLFLVVEAGGQPSHSRLPRLSCGFQWMKRLGDYSNAYIEGLNNRLNDCKGSSVHEGHTGGT